MICCGFALGIGASLARQVAEQGELAGVSRDVATPLEYATPAPRPATFGAVTETPSA